MKTKPRGVKKDSKYFVLQVRLSEEQKTAFEEAARREANNLSAFARTAMSARARELGVKI